MNGRYEVEDLLKLRASPLVAKPAGLPPKEEWMGPAETRARAPPTRNKPEDTFTEIGGFQKRPTLGESSRRSTTGIVLRQLTFGADLADPERLHLGPPRHSFTSSNARGRNHERTKTNEDQESPQLTRAELGGSRRMGGRALDHDADTEEPNPRQRKDHERPRWGPRDGHLEDEHTERFMRDGARRFDHPWARKDKSTDLDSDRHNNPPWRRAQRDREHEKQEAEPEWADAEIEPEPPIKARTQADFVEWMAKMKKADSTDSAAQPEMIQKETAAPVVDRAARIVSNPAEVEKFFAKYEERKTSEASQAPKQGKSRFASLFGAKDEPKAIETTPSAPIPVTPAAELEHTQRNPDTEKKANDAAFAKLLAMLNKNQAASAASTSPGPPTTAPGPIKQFNIAEIAELAATRSPEPSAIHPQSTRTPVTTHTPNLSLDRIIESRSPAHRVQPENSGNPQVGAQDLLDLLRRSDIKDKPVQPPSSRYDYAVHEPRMQPPPGLSRPAHENERIGSDPLDHRTERMRSMFHSPMHAGYEPDQQRQPQAPDHGGLGDLFASMNQNNFSSNAQQDRPIPRGPPGRPPGLDNRPGLGAPDARQGLGSRPSPGWPAGATQHRPPNASYNMPPQQPMYENMYPAQIPQHDRRLGSRNPHEGKPLGYQHYPPGFGPPIPYTYRADDIADQERQRNDYMAAIKRDQLTAQRGNGLSVPPGFSR